ncbi:MAG TPA: PIN domain-containing protein, partial [Epsilonproteobacteria bacterium]|nr:PIN domain-containing protein [Campylobacterota bacterium]
MKILLDTNVVLDLLLAREPFVTYAREIFVLIENAEIEGYLCANSVTTLHYLIGREKNKEEADEIISEL